MAFVPAQQLPRRRPRGAPICPLMKAPESVTRSNVLVVGGGPTGSAALAHLQSRHIPATLLERQSDFTRFDVTRAYTLRLDYRAVRVLRQVPRLFEHLAQRLQTTSGYFTSVLPASRDLINLQLAERRSKLPDLCDLRPAVVESFKTFVSDLPGVRAVYGATVTDIRIADDGTMTVVVDTPSGVATYETQLLLACDGRNSRVAQLLEAAAERGEPAHAPSGHGVEIHHSAAVGLFLKSIVLNKDLINELLRERHPEDFKIRGMTGDPARAFDDIFRFSIFPAGPEITERVGGFVGTVVRQPGHNIWNLRDVNSAYEYFQANFPQMDVRKAVSENEMRRFVDAKPSQLGDIRRRKSLVVKTGVQGGGAVVFLGDSAHAFPPDVGQGVCAAIADVGVFMEVLDNADDGASLEDIAVCYDKIRSDDCKALMRLSQYSSPYQYGVYPWRMKLWSVNFVLRKFLSKLLPGVIWPQMASMIPEDMTYREIVRRADATTGRLVGGAAAVAMAVVAMIVHAQLLG